MMGIFGFPVDPEYHPSAYLMICSGLGPFERYGKRGFDPKHGIVGAIFFSQSVAFSSDTLSS